MSEDSPKVASLETSLELSEFPSEAEFTSEAEVASAEIVSAAPATNEPMVATAPPALHSNVLTLSTTEPRLQPEDQPVTKPVTTAALVAQISTSPAQGPETDPADVVDPVRPPHAGPALIAEFPVKAQTPAAVALPTLPPGPMSLVDLIERRGGFDWREAVAVIQQICVYLRDHSPQTPIHLDPRTIQITERGEVRLLSGQTSSDPLVIQVGRLLRTMLVGKEVPPELRLLLSQATFELPIFESIDDVDRALAQLNKLDEPGPAGLALLRAMTAPPPAPDLDQDFEQRPPPIRSILPVHKSGRRRARGRGGLGSLLGGYGAHAAVILTGIALIGWLLMTQPEILFQKDNGAGAPAQLATLEVPTVQPGTTSTMGSGSPKSPVGGSGSATTPESASPASKSPSRPQASVTAHPSTRPAHETVQPAPNGTRPGTVRPEALPKPAPVVITPPAVVSPSPREHEKLASGLLEEGKPTEASQAFDNLVRNNPLYEPRRTDLTPEAISAFRKSQRTVLPAKAQDNYERGKAALSGGDYDTAMRLAREALAVIERHPDGMPPALRDRVEDLIDETKVTAASATEVIYSEADTDVRPPVQLSRTLPVNDPVGIPPSRVGWLDMVIGKDGTVFQVKLHTPLNRHHERMIVSAAKAFLFRPASRNGKPVMYRIKLRVTLPESGTDY